MHLTLILSFVLCGTCLLIQAPLSRAAGESTNQNVALDNEGLITSTFNSLRRDIKSNPMNLFEKLLTILNGLGVIPVKTNPTLISVASTYASDEKLIETMISVLDKTEQYASRSESAGRFIELLTLMSDSENFEENKQKGVALIQEKMGESQALIGSLLEDEDTIESFLQAVSYYFVEGHEMVQTLLEDDMKVTIMNGFLLANKFPMLNKYDQVSSIGAFLEKCVEMFTTYRAHDFPIASILKMWTEEFENHFFSLNDFQNKLNKNERVKVLATALSESVLEPLKDIKTLADHLQNHMEEECAELALCLFNENYAISHPILQSEESALHDKESVVHKRRVNKIQVKLVSLLSDWIVYAWSQVTTISSSPQKAEKLYQAIKNGHPVVWSGEGEGQMKKKKQGCRLIYPNSPPTCDVASSQRRPMYLEHNEL